MATFGDILKVLRERVGMGQAELSEKSGVHQGSISRYESEGRAPHWEAAVAIAEALGVSLDVFRGTSEAIPEYKKIKVVVSLVSESGEQIVFDETKKLPR